MGKKDCKNDRAQIVYNYLKGEGYLPDLDDDGDIRFKAEGRFYCVIVPNDDTTYYQLLFPNFWSIDSDEERAKVMKCALEVTAQIKVAKVYVVHDDTWADIEMFAAEPEHFTAVFSRAFDALRGAVENFAVRMHKDESTEK